MALEKKQKPGRYNKVMLVGQASLALLALACTIALPRGDQPALITPASGAGERALPGLLSQPGTFILARGAYDGSYVVRGEYPGFLEGLLDHGVLVLNSSAPGCGPIEVAPNAGAVST